MHKIFSLLLVLCTVSSSGAFSADYSGELFQSWKTLVGSRLVESMKASRNSGNFKVKITQSDLATQLNVSQSRISKIIGGSQPISLMQGLDAAKFLQVDPEWLLGLQLIRKSIDSDFPTVRSTTGSDFFFDIIQLALGRIPGTDLKTKENSCERSLAPYSTEDLVEELKSRGWNVNLSRQ